MTNTNVRTTQFFDALISIENKEYSFASPATLYKRNAHLYALPNVLCPSDTVKQSLLNFDNDMLEWQTSTSVNVTMERFCAPSYDSATDFSFCYKAMLKHKNIAAVMFLSFVLPFLLYIIFFGLSTYRGNTDCKICRVFYYIEDVNSFINAIFLTAFSMELADGMPSGVKNSTCSNETTGLYPFYIKFLAIFIFLGFGFFFNILCAAIDLFMYLQDDVYLSEVTWWKLQGTVVATTGPDTPVDID